MGVITPLSGTVAPASPKWYEMKRVCSPGHLQSEPEIPRFTSKRHKESFGQALLKSFSNFGEHQNRMGGLLKLRLLGPGVGMYGSGGLGWHLRTCIYNKFLGGIDAPWPGTTL